MKKIIFTAVLLMMLCSCSGQDPSQTFIDIRASYLASDVTLTAELTADYGDRRYDYTLSYIGDGKRGEVSVLSPDIISGISVEIDENKKISLKCDDIIIDTGVVYGTGVSPIEALPLIVNAVREGYVTEVYTESLDGADCIAVEIDDTPAGEKAKTLYTLWFSAADNKLHKAELTVDGFTVISASFKEVQ